MATEKAIIRANTIKDDKANQVVPEYTKWCNNTSACMYKDKKRKYHGWLNLDNLSKKNKVAQCGWDDGNCNHSTHYGIGGYHNVCPIAGINGDYVWPARVMFSNFDFKKNKITSHSNVKSITVSFENRMVAIDTGTGKKYDNFGPTFHANKNDWATKIYFMKDNSVVSKVKEKNTNPVLSKTKFEKHSYKFKGFSIDDILDEKFKLVMEYNHNFNTNPGIIYLRNVYIEVEFDNAKIFIKGSRNGKKIYTGTETNCKTTLQHTITAGYKNDKKVIPPSEAPEILGSKIQCIKAPKNVKVTKLSSDNEKTVFKIEDNSLIKGDKKIVYNISNHKKYSTTLEYTAVVRKKPTYKLTRVYKSNEDFDSKKPYIIFKNGCASKIYIYVDSVTSTPITLNVANQNDPDNLLNETEIEKFHSNIKKLDCGVHTLYMQRGDETIEEAQKLSAQIKIKNMNFQFKFSKSNGETGDKLKFESSYDSPDETIIIERIDNEPIAEIPEVKIVDETNPSSDPVIAKKVKKGDKISHIISKKYDGKFFITLSFPSICSKNITQLIKIEDPAHTQSHDTLFVRGEDGTGFNTKYLVVWEGDNIKEKVSIDPDSITFYDPLDKIAICSDSASGGLFKTGFVKLNVRNKSNEALEDVDIELNVLEEDDNGNKVVTTKEWVDPEGIFNKFYDMFYQYNAGIQENVSILNLTTDNDLVDEENVYLSINKIDANENISMLLPFKSVVEKTVYLQYLIFEEKMKINSILDCEQSIFTSDNDTIEINICDSMLTDLEITGNTDLLILDPNYSCPDECYTTKDTVSGEPVSDKKTGGITYKITNIDTNDFAIGEDIQIVKTIIKNSQELTPYGYISEGKYYSLLDNNGDYISVTEDRPIFDSNGNPMYEQILDENDIPQNDSTKPLLKPNKLVLKHSENLVQKNMNQQNIFCVVQFPNDVTPLTYRIQTNLEGMAEFFIPIPDTIDTGYTITELLTDILYFEFKEQDEYNYSILTKKSSFVAPNQTAKKVFKNDTFLEYTDSYKKYKPGEVAYIPVHLTTKINMIENYFEFYPELDEEGSSDEVTIMYQVCNIQDNEGIFKTKFKTDDKLLIENEVEKDIYCGIPTSINLKTRIEKDIVEFSNLNILYISVENQIKHNKDVKIRINLGKDISERYLGKYDFFDINIEEGDYSIEEVDGNIFVYWLIGEMNPFEQQKAIIKIKASDVGLSKIKIKAFDYLHISDEEEIIVKQSKCEKCEEETNWTFKDSAWSKFNGELYKLFNDGKWKKPVMVKENGVLTRKWVEKQ